ncbi:hypothetical protein BGW36DRAFT_424998 [Talaromyces proteolyticus]|uniref:ABM domain-containing protein n=1 Tax=Talaromyces proteolyticus TaxID=1131652 RepID=A0AAD4Q2B8_9EURO|nr:uncharacterized protein BGW36DRAFT_424998 [Talaromyces proteolyticus]KAH8700163.1 hypothetical protein BGW36DRAFT_424998 [Talaromyces proteolyticus]
MDIILRLDHRWLIPAVSTYTYLEKAIVSHIIVYRRKIVMFVIAPLSNCASTAKRDRFIEYLSKIAPVTYKNEPKCRAYAWFRSAEDNDTVPHHWLRGLEVYEDVEANTITHRASAEYKAFRAAVGAEGLLERPSDLRFWRPSSIGFLKRDESSRESEIFQDRSHTTSPDALQYIVIDEMTPRLGYEDIVIEQLCGMAHLAEQNDQILSFWVLNRGDEAQDQGILVFSRYKNRNASISDKAASAWKEVYALSNEQRRTTWVESGLGFLGR